MNLSDGAKAAVFAAVAVLALLFPLSLFDTEFDGIDNERVDWSCPRPISGFDSGDLDEIRADLAQLPEGETLAATHPDCTPLAVGQIVVAAISTMVAAFFFWRVWQSGSGRRAEKKFTRLHESAGKGRDVRAT